MRCIVPYCESTYLRRPNFAELKIMMDRNAERGFPGCICSLDCSHWAWHQCPRSMAGRYQSRKGSRGIDVEAVCDEDLWIWHLFVSAPRSLSDINVMHQSPRYLHMTAGRWPPRKQSYTLNGTTRLLPYQLVDSFNPRYAFLMSPHPKPTTEEHKVFLRFQDAVSKDVERLFGVLTQRFHIAFHPGRYRSVKMLILTFKALCSLHDMCVEIRLEGFLSRRRRAEGANEGGVAGDAEGEDVGSGSAEGSRPHDEPVGGDSGQGGGAVVGAAAATGGPAPGGAHAGANTLPLFIPVDQPPAGGMAADFDTRGQTHNADKHAQLRAVLTTYMWSDRGDLLAPHLS